jgi:hypothetical protein
MTLALNAKLHLKASLTCSIELHTSRCMQFYGNMMCAYDGCVSIYLHLSLPYPCGVELIKWQTPLVTIAPWLGRHYYLFFGENVKILNKYLFFMSKFWKMTKGFMKCQTLNNDFLYFWKSHKHKTSSLLFQSFNITFDYWEILFLIGFNFVVV